MRLLAWIPVALGAALAQVDAQAPRQVRSARMAAATSREAFTTVANARALPGGLVLVNDIAKRRVLLLDSTLALVRIVIDSASNPASSYGQAAGGLIAWRGDSTLFVDPVGLSMMVLDPKGNIARVMSVPRTQDARALAGTGSMPGFDASGKLVYRAAPAMNMQRMTMGPGGGAAAAAAHPPATTTGAAAGDSAVIQRVDFATRAVDTAGFIRIPKAAMMTMNQGANGAMTVSSSAFNPLQTVDEWAVMDDGTIAIVRGQSYHVDWISTDGKVTSSPKIAFDWRRMSDDDKVAFIDSTKKAMEAARANPQTMSMGGAGPMVIGGGGGGGMVVNGGTRVIQGGGGGGGAGPVISFGPGGGAGGMSMPGVELVPASELPDYRPAFGNGAVRADRDGNLWVRTSAAVPGGEPGPIYDVINSKGELIDRVQLANGRTIVGFALGGIAYVFARTDLGTTFERVKVR